MRFLIDENVNSAIGAFFGREHDVKYVVDVLGSGAKDPTIARLLRTELRSGWILVTADKAFALKCGQEGSRLPCLFLRDLRAAELERCKELADVIVSEAAISGQRLFFEIRDKSFTVRR